MEKTSQTYNKLISVIIPTYKRSDRLTNAINSVLKQTYSPIEIIVVDDNENDEFRRKTEISLQSFIEKNQIKYLKHAKNKGACEARNTGAKIALGEYISFLDDDDFYEPEKIETQATALNTNVKIDACLCAMFRIDENGEQIISKENFPRGENLKEAILNGNFFTSMLMIRKSVFEKLGGFSNIPRFQDRFFMFKYLKNNYELKIINAQLLTLVEHNAGRISLSSSKKVLEALDILHQFEIENKNLFNVNEWKKIKYRYHYMKAYNLLHKKTLRNRFNALKNIIQALPFYNKESKILKTFLKIFIP